MTGDDGIAIAQEQRSSDAAMHCSTRTDRATCNRRQGRSSGLELIIRRRSSSVGMPEASVEAKPCPGQEGS